MAFDMSELSPEITPDEIRAAREELGMTQKELAQFFGVDHTTISRWELGAVPCGVPGAVKYALEYLRLRQHLQADEVFANLDAHIERTQKLRDEFARQLAEFEARRR